MKQITIGAIMSLAFMAQAGNYNIVVGNGNNVHGNGNTVHGNQDNIQGNQNTQIGDRSHIYGNNNYQQGSDRQIWGNNHYVVSQHPEPNPNAYHFTGFSEQQNGSKRQKYADQQEESNSSNQPQNLKQNTEQNLKKEDDSHKINFPNIKTDNSPFDKSNDYFQSKRQQLRQMIAQRMKIHKSMLGEWNHY